jgi:hypothetical protein
MIIFRYLLMMREELYKHPLVHIKLDFASRFPSFTSSSASPTSIQSSTFAEPITRLNY